MEYSQVAERYESVELFNKIAGVFDINATPQEQIKRAIKIFKEEVNETFKAYEEKDSVELLDGVCDSFVTLCGLIQTLEHVGFDVEWALERVCDNNLSKFSDTLNTQPQNTEATYHEASNSYVFKDKNGKVKKPIGFKPVYLQDLVPSNVWYK